MPSSSEAPPEVDSNAGGRVAETAGGSHSEPGCLVTFMGPRPSCLCGPLPRYNDCVGITVNVLI